MSVALDMNSQQYKYFETLNPGGPPQMRSGKSGHVYGPGASSEDPLAHLHELSSPFLDSSLHAHPFWQIAPHIISLLFVWYFISIYFNTNALFFYPILFFTPFILSIFIILPIQNMFSSNLLPGIINNISWSFWFGGIGAFIIASLVNWGAPVIFENIDEDTRTVADSKSYIQYKYILSALFLTALFDETVKFWICHRGFKKYFSLSPPLSQINHIILYCMAVGMGIGIAKGVIALILLGNDDDLDDRGLILDYRYGLIDYIILPWQTIDEHDWKVVCIYSFIIVPFHTVLGALWGIGFVRRYVLEHYVAFGQMLALPWVLHGLSNLLLVEVYYNLDSKFENDSIWLTATIMGPIFFMIAAIIGFFLVFKRRIDPSLNRLVRGVRVQNPSDI